MGAPTAIELLEDIIADLEGKLNLGEYSAADESWEEMNFWG